MSSSWACFPVAYFCFSQRARLRGNRLGVCGVTDDPLDVLEALIESNRQRAKNYEQIGREANALKAIEQGRAKVRQQATQLAGKATNGKPKKTSVVEPVPPPSKGKTRDAVGQKLGTSGKTAEAAGHVVVTIDTLTKASRSFWLSAMGVAATSSVVRLESLADLGLIPYRSIRLIGLGRGILAKGNLFR